MTRKYSSISVETTLASGINTTQTTLTVPNSAAATALLGGETLAAGNVDIFTVVIDPDTVNEEVVYVTDVSGDTLTISRGQAGTGTAGVSGIAHSAGATIRHVLTSDDLDYFRDGLPASIFTAKGDVVAATAAGAASRLAVGTNGQVLTADSSAATGLAWSTISQKVVQVVSTFSSGGFTTTSTTAVDSGITATITPTSSSNKIFVLLTFQSWIDAYTGSGIGGTPFTFTKIIRGTSTQLVESYAYATSNTLTNYVGLSFPGAVSILDTPSTTSATTYKLQNYKSGSNVQAYINNVTLTLMEVTP